MSISSLRMNKANFYLVVLMIGASVGCSHKSTEQTRWCDELPRPVDDSLKTKFSNDWFEVYRVQDDIYAIYEPYQWQEVISYLIIGDSVALLFDTGNGIGNIKEVVESITPLPIRVLNSHSHFDHVGGNADFSFIYGMDTEFTRGRKPGRTHEQVADEVSPAALCKPLPDGVTAEGHHIKPYEIDEVVSEGYVIDLGTRKLKVISIPGHTPDAIGLLDEQNGLLWTGDTFYKGPIWLFATETDLAAYKKSIARLATLAPSVRYVLPAHNSPIAEPHLLVELNKALDGIERGVAKGTTNSDGRMVYSFSDFSILMAK
jgi:glyoxylase-like metal-dependent hydrolase (beta-lactamase superfamily II)